MAGNIVFAVAKPPIAKISNVVGRAEAYSFCIGNYLLGYILCASANSFGVYAGGFIFANLGMTGANILNDIIIADITSMRSRAFAIGISFFPFLITPWVSGFIVQDVVGPGGIGWRWGIGLSTPGTSWDAAFGLTRLFRHVCDHHAILCSCIDSTIAVLPAQG